MDFSILFLGLFGLPLLAFAGYHIIKAILENSYRQECAKFGWSYDPNPGLNITYSRNKPPFGLGFQRSTDNHVWGTAGGLQFSRFTYRNTVSGRSEALTFLLPRPLSEVFVSRPGAERIGAQGVRVLSGGWSVIAPDAQAADAAARVLVPVLDQVVGADGALNVSLDGPWAVFTDAPREPKLLAPWAEGAARVAHAASELAVTGPVLVPPEASFYHRPTWVYRARDNSFLASVDHTRGGSNHEAREVVLGTEAGISFVGFEHHWQTESTDSDGDTTTHYHEEPILECALPWRFEALSLDWPRTGSTVRFESEQFNRTFTIRAANDRFAYDVIHPRQMEYLLAVHPVPFKIANGRLRFNVVKHDPAIIFECMRFAAGFFARVPEFVWENMGLPDQPPELRAYERGEG